jgi:hypothetical protein
MGIITLHLWLTISKPNGSITIPYNVVCETITWTVTFLNIYTVDFSCPAENLKIKTENYGTKMTLFDPNRKEAAALQRFIFHGKLLNLYSSILK